MRRLWILFLLIAWTPALQARAPLPTKVELPASLILAGPLDAQESQLGDEFFHFPEPLGRRPRPGESPLSGWIEFRFEPVPGDPDRARFTFTYDTSGATDMWSFENGDTWLLDDNRAFSNPRPTNPNEGVLNLVTGEIESMTVNPIFQNSTISQVTRNNRIPFAFTPTYPFDLAGASTLISSLPPEVVPLLVAPELLDLQPGFVFSEAFFTFSTDGRITGFKFFGWTVVPVGIAAVLNPLLAPQGLSPFPIFSFGLNGEFHFAHPYECPATATFCPNPEDDPNGMLLPSLAFFRPYFALGSEELSVAAPAPAAPDPCALEPRAGSLLIAHGEKLYQIGGRTPEGTTGRVDVYDLDTRTWSEAAPLPMPAADAQGGAIGSRIYVFGGRAPSGGIRRALQVFDTVTGEWTEGEKGPFGVANGAASVAGESLYVIGGRTYKNPNGLPYNKGVLIYHAGFPSGWDRLDPTPDSAPSFTEGSSAVTVGTEIWVLGGKKLDPITGEVSVTDEVSVLNTVSRRFKAGPSLLWGTFEAAAGRLGNRIYLAGGRQEVHGRSTADVQVLVIGQEEWRETRPLLVPIAKAGSAAVRGEVFVAGGVTFDRDKTRAFQTLNVGRGWSVCGNQPLFSSTDVLNSAALTVGPRPLSPGSLAVLTGYNLDGVTGVTVDGEPATIVSGPATISSVNSQFTVAALPQRLWFEIPAGTSGDRVPVEILSPSSAHQAPAVEVPFADVGPGVFLENQDEARNELYLDTGSALACNGDGTLNYAANPAAPGQTVTLRMTGLGSDPSPASVHVVVDGIPAAVNSVAPGGPAGLWEVEIVVPAAARSANRIPVWAEVDGVASNEAALAILRAEDLGMVTRPALGIPFPIPLPCRSPIPGNGS